MSDQTPAQKALATQAAAKALMAGASSAPVEQAAPVVVPTSAVPVPTKLYHKFRLVRPTGKMLTDKGLAIIFINYLCITDNPQIISYLNNEIEAGLGLVTAEGTVTSESLNPMEDMKKRHIAEYLKEQEALKETTAGAGNILNTGVLSTSQAIGDASNSSNS